MSYQFKESTLLHGIGFNFFKLESILNYGILSENEALIKKEIAYSRNYFGYNSSDMISMVALFKLNPNDLDSSYNKYIKNGISFIVENLQFIYDRREIVFHRPDEVYVKDKVPVSNIKSILVPEDLVDADFEDLTILPLDSTSYINIKKACDNIGTYVRKYGYEIDKDEYDAYLKELRMINKLGETDTSQSIKDEFKDTIVDLNSFMGYSFKECFKKVLNNNSLKPIDIINYISSKYKIPVLVEDFNVMFIKGQEKS